MSQRVNILIASPGDVQKERDSVPKIFTRWNSSNDYAILHPTMWESAAVPTMGAHPQHLLNERLIRKSDLLVAILWSKLGTPTPTASSGTVEEIREFIRLKGPQRAMLYFCRRDLPYDTDPAEMVKLRDFKAQMRTQGIYHEYTTQEEFERDLYQHLGIKVDEFVTGKLPTPEPAVVVKPQADLPPDKRLHQLLEFGTTLQEIANGFATRMAEFLRIDGVHPDKYYRLGAHVYTSAAAGLDRFLTYSAAGMSEQNRSGLERISSRLKRLAQQIPKPGDPFPDYWKTGQEIADDLSAHVVHIERSRR